MPDAVVDLGVGLSSRSIFAYELVSAVYGVQIEIGGLPQHNYGVDGPGINI